VPCMAQALLDESVAAYRVDVFGAGICTKQGSLTGDYVQVLSSANLLPLTVGLRRKKRSALISAGRQPRAMYIAHTT
jgi:hypothetical protein